MMTTPTADEGGVQSIHIQRAEINDGWAPMDPAGTKCFIFTRGMKGKLDSEFTT